MIEKIEILGIPFAKLTQAEAVDTLKIFLDEPKNHVIVTPNPEGVMQARRNAAFSDALKSADLALADGTGILLASIFLRRRLPERVRGVDTVFALFEKLSEELSKSGRVYSAYFLGGKPGIAEAAAENMQAKFPALNVIGTHHGYFTDEAEILAEINALAPDILLVCTGMPRAEIFAAQNINARLTMCLGGTLDIMAGAAKLAPSFARKIGLEWLVRLFREPRRFRRMLDIPRFVFAVIFSRFRR